MEAGETDIDAAEFKVTTALLLFAVSAALVAVTVTVWELPILEGAVYKPLLEIVPVDGLKDHVTAVLVVLLTVAVNCWLCDSVRVAVPGVRETATGGFNVRVALALAVESAALVAMTVTVWVFEILEGAV